MPEDVRRIWGCADPQRTAGRRFAVKRGLSLFLITAALSGSCVLSAGENTAQAAAGESELMLQVDTSRILRSGANHWIGIDLNYYRDNDANRPEARPLRAALKDLGTKWLRYPGGEKSNFYLFARPPYTRAQPVTLPGYAKRNGKVMNFDEYIACCRSAGATPFVVVGYRSEAKSGMTEAQWNQNAVEWVRYANKRHHYGVKYWEIGNENWHENKAMTPEAMGEVVVHFSRAMKAIDPSIHVGASCNGSNAWDARFLPRAAPALDFVTESVYNTSGWHNYDYLLGHPQVDLSRQAEAVLRQNDLHTGPADQKRLRLIVTETNSKDFGEDPWPGDNTLGHALVTFETFGALMEHRRLDAAMLWTTRWMSDAEAAHSQWYALGPENQLLPSGRAVALWGEFVQDEVLEVSGSSGSVRAYASVSKDRTRLVVWLVNRGLEESSETSLRVHAPAAYHVTGASCFTGSGPDDENPTWRTIPLPAVHENVLIVPYLPPVSVTVLTLAEKRL